MTYAEWTKTPVSKSRGEIEKLLRRQGCTALSWADDYDSGMSEVRFRWRSEVHDGAEVLARLRVQRATLAEARATFKVNASRDQVERRVDQMWRTKHRQLLLWLRAQFVAVEADITTVEHAFLPYLEDASGRTVAEALVPQIGSFGVREVAALSRDTESGRILLIDGGAA